MLKLSEEKVFISGDKISSKHYHNIQFRAKVHFDFSLLSYRRPYLKDMWWYFLFYFRNPIFFNHHFRIKIDLEIGITQKGNWLKNS